MTYFYHHACTQKYISHSQLADDAMHLQDVSLSEARSLFFRHVDNVIFNEHEIRSLQALLTDYKCIVGGYWYQVGCTKNSHSSSPSFISSTLGGQGTVDVLFTLLETPWARSARAAHR